MPNLPTKHRVALPTSPPKPRLSSTERGYGTRWKKARLVFLNDNPLCVRCEAKGLTVGACVVDHIKPHKGDETLFWDSEGNWQALCDRCHRTKSAAEDGTLGNPIRGAK